MPPQRTRSATSDARSRLYHVAGPWKAKRKQPLSAPLNSAASIACSALGGGAASACRNQSTGALAALAPASSCAPRFAAVSRYVHACSRQSCLLYTSDAADERSSVDL